MPRSQLSGEFAGLHAALRGELDATGRAALDRLTALAPSRSPRRTMEDLGPAANAALAAAARLPYAAKLARALVAGLAAEVDRRLVEARMPARVLERSAEWQPRLLRFLVAEAGEDYRFPAGEFVKDYRFACALTVPCGAQVVDLNAAIGPKTALKLAAQSPAAGLRAVSGPWLRPHTDSRYLEEFDEPGWERCYREVAAVLERVPALRGLVATSWFYDPRLAVVSPRLGYLRTTPMAAGARLVRHRTTAFDVAAATATSPTRRALHAAGEYLPVSHSIVWERDDLIAWARGGPGTG